jgi:hypothetical protein
VGSTKNLKDLREEMADRIQRRQAGIEIEAQGEHGSGGRTGSGIGVA